MLLSTQSNTLGCVRCRRNRADPVRAEELVLVEHDREDPSQPRLVDERGDAPTLRVGAGKVCQLRQPVGEAFTNPHALHQHRVGLVMFLPSPLYLLAVKDIGDSGSSSNVLAVVICAIGVMLFVEIHSLRLRTARWGRGRDQPFRQLARAKRLELCGWVGPDRRDLRDRRGDRRAQLNGVRLSPSASWLKLSPQQLGAGRRSRRSPRRIEGTKEALALVAEPDTQPTSRSACVARFWMVRRYLP